MFLTEDRQMVQVTFRKFRHLYKKGIYLLHYDSRIHKYYFRRWGVDGEKHFSAPSTAAQKLKALCRCLFCGPIRFSPSDGGAVEEFLVTYRRYIKVFDGANQTVTTYGCSDEQLQLAERYREKYSAFFSPYILAIDRPGRRVTETYIRHREGWAADPAAYRAFADWLIDSYCRYAAAVPLSEVSFVSAADVTAELRRTADGGLQRLLAHIAPAWGPYGSIPLPLIDNHNDVKPDNILYDGQRFYLIDYEMFRPNLLGFDILMYALLAAFRYRDDRLLTDYRSGRYDVPLAQVFSRFGIPFDAQRRDALLYLALLFGMRHSLAMFGSIQTAAWDKLFAALTGAGEP